MIEVFLIFNVAINIILSFCLYNIKGKQKKEEDIKQKEEINEKKIIYAIHILLTSNLEFLEQRQIDENSIIELESLKYINDFLLNELENNYFYEKGLNMLHPFVICEVPEICGCYETDNLLLYDLVVKQMVNRKNIRSEEAIDLLLNHMKEGEIKSMWKERVYTKEIKRQLLNIQ